LSAPACKQRMTSFISSQTSRLPSGFRNR
jgi:hypothetical protein